MTRIHYARNLWRLIFASILFYSYHSGNHRYVMCVSSAKFASQVPRSVLQKPSGGSLSNPVSTESFTQSDASSDAFFRQVKPVNLGPSNKSPSDFRSKFNLTAIGSGATEIGADVESIKKLTRALDVNGSKDCNNLNLGYFFLQKELKISDYHLTNILQKHHSILYLKVDSNLRPTVEVFKSFGFRDKDIRRMVESCPYVLAINHEWTLPEKLISIQKMFNLNRAGLIKMVVKKPFLLTSSIERNIAISNCLQDEALVGMTPDEIRKSLLSCPSLAMTSVVTIKECWKTLTDKRAGFGLSGAQARKMCVRHPKILTRSALDNRQKLIKFLSDDLKMPPSEGAAKKMVLHCPQLLYVQVDVFMRPNLRILREQLGLDEEGVKSVVSFFPALILHNPRTLAASCRRVMYLLTGLEQYRRLGPQQTDQVLSGISTVEGEAEGDVDVDVYVRSSSPLEIDLNGPLDDEDGTLMAKGEAVDAEVTEGGIELNGVSDFNQADAMEDILESFSDVDDFIEDFSFAYSGVDVDAEVDVDDEAVDEDIFEVMVNVPRGNSRRIRTRAQQTEQREKMDEFSSAKISASTANVFEAVEYDSAAASALDLLSSFVASNRGQTTKSPESQSAAAAAAREIELTRVMMQVYSTLSLDSASAINLLRKSPWILSYKYERSLRVLGTAGMSLGLSRSELSSCLQKYCRLLCLSPSADAKIGLLFSTLAAAAEKYVKSMNTTMAGSGIDVDAEVGEQSSVLFTGNLERSLVSHRKYPSYAAAEARGREELRNEILATVRAERSREREAGVLKENDVDVNVDGVTADIDIDSGEVSQESEGVAVSNGVSVDASDGEAMALVEEALSRRADPVRSLVRLTILKNPTLLGKSMAEIVPALELLMSLQLPFSDLCTILRQSNSPAQTKKLRARIAASQAIIAQDQDQNHKLQVEGDDRDDDDDDGNSNLFSIISEEEVGRSEIMPSETVDTETASTRSAAAVSTTAVGDAAPKLTKKAFKVRTLSRSLASLLRASGELKDDSR